MSAQQSKRDHERLLDNLKVLQKTHSVVELAEALGVSKTTWIARMKEPWRTFSYDDFMLISKYCKVDLAQLLCGELKIR